MCDNCKHECTCKHGNGVLTIDLVCVVDRNTGEVNEIYEAGNFKRYINDNFLRENEYYEDIKDCIDLFNDICDDGIASINTFRMIYG